MTNSIHDQFCSVFRACRAAPAVADRTATARAWDRVRAAAFSPGTTVAGRPVAAFDFDSTLRPYRGSGYPEAITIPFLAHLSATCDLLIITNRAGDSETALAPVKDYVARLDRVTDGRVTVYAPTAHDRERKPHTGTWEHYVRTTHGGVAPAAAFYCGDAGGRPDDFSATDLMFAHNCGIPFVVPEAVFGTVDAWAEGCVLPPLTLPPAADEDAGLDVPAGLCVFVLVGSPASGKSRIATRLVDHYGFTLVSGDAQGTRHKGVYDRALAARQSIVVDNTNPTVAHRAYFTRRASAHAYQIVICHVTTPKNICFHLNAARCQLDASGATKEVPAVALHTYWKRMEPPTDEEVACGSRSSYLVRVPFAVSPGAPPEVTSFRYPTE
jgi:DNA 3'-phosphatase